MPCSGAERADRLASAQPDATLPSAASTAESMRRINAANSVLKGPNRGSGAGRRKSLACGGGVGSQPSNRFPDWDTKTRQTSVGSVSIEALLLIPVALLVLVIVLQGSLWFQARTVAQVAAADGAAAASWHGSDRASGERAALAVLEQRLVGTDWQLDWSWSADLVELRVHGLARSVWPGLELPVEQTALAVREP
ncbi:MAG: pilus assembly protein [Propionibacteriaceae bacterium]|nr:pilus assembly protein [Propionibacteriaceae bacterium]